MRKILLPCMLVLISLSRVSNVFAFSGLPPQMALSKTTYQHLQGWQHNNPSQALLAFKRSCFEIMKRAPDSAIHPYYPQYSAQQWQTICKAANLLSHPNAVSSRRFFEHWFTPYHLAYRFEDSNHYQGLFTGYYLPLIHARLHPNMRFRIPIYALPVDLVKLPGRPAVIRQRKNNRLLPYPNRAAIVRGEIHHKAKVLAWSDSEFDVFFAHVQGSAMVELPNKKRFMIGYAGSNGQAYTPIGRVLIDRGELSKENVSMQSIRHWLLKHPRKADELLNQNESYVFFRILNQSDPIGTENVALTSQHSLAVDNRYIPFASPIWVDTIIPNYPSGKDFASLQKLLIAQDTGGAIKGIVRGDIYWGAGKKAEFIAGQMNSLGQAWILLPRNDVFRNK
jgi:membrane-bound lytic murein transglycosylase A